MILINNNTFVFPVFFVCNFSFTAIQHIVDSNLFVLDWYSWCSQIYFKLIFSSFRSCIFHQFQLTPSEQMRKKTMKNISIKLNWIFCMRFIYGIGFADFWMYFLLPLINESIFCLLDCTLNKWRGILIQLNWFKHNWIGTEKRTISSIKRTIINLPEKVDFRYTLKNVRKLMKSRHD